jgi:glycosyltransferase involved in cell wall biosynthesis
MPPFVSIIIPCFNEQATIRDLLAAVYAQTYPRADLEVVIADGMSTDGTRDGIAAFADEHADLHVAVVDNPRRIIPAALNLAIQNAHGEIILRLDAHSMPHPDYVERCVADLEAGLGENVGGIWEIHTRSGWATPSTATQRNPPTWIRSRSGPSSANCLRWSGFSTRCC